MISLLPSAGSALTTFNKGAESLQPKVIALRSLQYTSGEMLYNPEAYAEFKAKININDEVCQIRMAACGICCPSSCCLSLMLESISLVYLVESFIGLSGLHHMLRWD